MDHNLLRSWLGLPPGKWPPDHYALLALTPGEVDAPAVEPLVLTRMDALRQHQLLNPELVTEGMNRLAQALITLTEASSKAAYDAELGLQLVLPTPTRKATARTHVESIREAPLVVARPVTDDAFLEDDAPLGIPAALDATQEIAIPSFEVIESKIPRTQQRTVVADHTSEAANLSLSRATIEAVSVGGPREGEAESRRWIYARLALLRKAQRAWKKLQPNMADPDCALDRPAHVLTLLEAAGCVRPLLPALRGIIGDIGEPGGIVVALLRQTLILDTLRRLLPDQRQALAEDWNRAQVELSHEYSRLRQLAQSNRERNGHATGGLEFGRWLRDNPEWVLLILSGLVVFVALVRGSGNS